MHYGLIVEETLVCGECREKGRDVQGVLTYQASTPKEHVKRWPKKVDLRSNTRPRFSSASSYPLSSVLGALFARTGR